MVVLNYNFFFENLEGTHFCVMWSVGVILLVVIGHVTISSITSSRLLTIFWTVLDGVQKAKVW